MRVLFMGTPDFAVPSLKALHKSEQTVAGVVTVPDKPRGRGQKLRPSAVKRAAQQLQLPIFQPGELGDPAFLSQVRELQVDLMVVVAFRILPESCYSIPRHGAINLHASLLPEYRGAAPIQRALMNGEPRTGVSTFFLERSVDTGAILMQEAIEIGPNENAGSVHDRLAELGADVVLRTIRGIENNSLQPVPQREAAASKAPKITREDRYIRWQQKAEEVHNQIRALSPYPGAFTVWDDSRLIIYEGRISDAAASPDTAEPGEVISVEDEYIHVATGEGCYAIWELQPQGKRRMSAGDFLNGYDLLVGDVLQ